MKNGAGSPRRRKELPNEEAELYRHYRIAFDQPSGTRGTDDAMTRSEEELNVGTTSRPTGRARLRKWVETDHVQKTVPVQKERVRLEKDVVSDERTVDAEIRRERVEIEGDADVERNR